MLDNLISDVEAFGAALRRGKSVNVNDQSSKDRAIALTTRYFAEARPLVLQCQLGEQAIAEHDERWQQLVRLAHGNNARQRYVRIMAALRKDLVNFSVAALSTASRVSAGEKREVVFSQEEASILTTLDGLVPSAAASYRQGLIDLYGGERLSYRGTAADFREALREALDHLAPDVDVQAQAGFVLEKDQSRPTQKQKMRYVLKSRGQNKAQRDTAEKALSLVDELAGDVMRAVYTRASLATHVQSSKDEVRKIKRYVDTLFFELLEIR